MFSEEFSQPSSEPPIGVRGGPSGAFVDFDLLPYLMTTCVRSREDTIESWTTHLETFGFEARHIDPESVPQSLSLAAMLASDAWRFSERMGLIDVDGPTTRGVQFALLIECDERHREERLRKVLREGLEANLRGRGGVSILDLMGAAANTLWESKNLWARTCPGLLPIEVGAIVHWARTNPLRAVELVDKIEVWRDVAMHSVHRPPSSTASREANAERHFDAVVKFYLEHHWLAEDVPSLFAEEHALAKLLAWSGLFKECSLGAVGFCLIPISKVKGNIERVDMMSGQKRNGRSWIGDHATRVRGTRSGDSLGVSVFWLTFRNQRGSSHGV